MSKKMFQAGLPFSAKWFPWSPPKQRRRGAEGRFGFERLEERRVLSAATLINEIDVNCPSESDNRYMYVELQGTPGASLNNLYIVAFQSGGNAEFVQSLSGYSIGADGLAVIKNSTGGFSIPAATTLIPNNTFFTSQSGSGFSQDTLSFYLFSSPTPFVEGTDYDTNNDGTLDHLPTGATVLDNVAVIAKGSNDLTYGGVVIHNLGSGGTPDAVTRFFGNNTTTTAAWFGGELVDTGNMPSQVEYDVTRPGTNMPLTTSSFITPGTLNYPVPAGPTLTPSGSTATFTAGSCALVLDAGITLTDPESTTISSATITTVGYSEDVYGFTTPPTMTATITQGHNGQGSVNVITLTGLDTVANYQAALRSITYQDTASTNVTQGTRTLSIVVNDGVTTTSPATETVKVTVPAPVVTASGTTGTFTVGGAAVAVDAGLAVSSYDADLSGATVTISAGTLQSGDTLNFVSQNGISGGYSAGVLSLSGSATPAQYQTALQSITFSTTSTNTTTRSLSIVAIDGSLNSSPAAESVNVTVPAPVVTASGTQANYTAGAAAVYVDSGVTVSSYDTDLSGATVTISSGTLQSGDTLNFVSQNGISGNYSAGVLSLSGSATPAQYQTALQSVTFSSTSTSTTARAISIVALDNSLTSNSAAEQVNVFAPVTVAGVYVRGSNWTSNYLTYLAANAPGGSATLGYELQTGSAQLTTLPWANINTIEVQFSGPVSGVATGSLELVGGTGVGAVAAPTVTGESYLGNNTYAWTLSGPLDNNKYVIAVASTNSSFGPAVVDANAAGISGEFATGSSTFANDGNGLAGGTFDFSFNVLPGDANQNGTDNSSDSAFVKGELNDRTTTAGYNYLADYNGTGTINSADTAVDDARLNVRNSTLTAPSAPSAGSVGVVSLGTDLALGAIETGNPTTTGRPTTTPLAAIAQTSGVSTPSPTTSSSSSTRTSTSGSGSGGTSTTTSGHRGHGNHFTVTHEAAAHEAATDAAVSDFELTDLWA